MSNPKKLFLKAIDLYEEHKVQDAVSVLEQAIALDTKYVDAHEILGHLYAELNQIDKAISITKELAGLDPDSVMAHANLSRFYQQKGLIEEAEREQNEARRLSWKSEIKARKALGIEGPKKVKKEDSGLRSVEERIQTFQDIIARFPEDVLGYFSLGNVYMESKQFLEAEKTFRKAIEADPGHSPSYYYLGQAQESLGKRGEAILTYRKGVKVAEEKGDLVPKNKMQLRLKVLEK